MDLGVHTHPPSDDSATSWSALGPVQRCSRAILTLPAPCLAWNPASRTPARLTPCASRSMTLVRALDVGPSGSDKQFGLGWSARKAFLRATLLGENALRFC